MFVTFIKSSEIIVNAVARSIYERLNHTTIEADTIVVKYWVGCAMRRLIVTATMATARK
jgi:hypothetical protein